MAGDLCYFLLPILALFCSSAESYHLQHYPTNDVDSDSIPIPQQTPSNCPASAVCNPPACLHKVCRNFPSAACMMDACNCKFHFVLSKCRRGVCRLQDVTQRCGKSEDVVQGSADSWSLPAQKSDSIPVSEDEQLPAHAEDEGLPFHQALPFQRPTEEAIDSPNDQELQFRQALLAPATTSAKLTAPVGPATIVAVTNTTKPALTAAPTTIVAVPNTTNAASTAAPTATVAVTRKTKATSRKTKASSTAAPMTTATSATSTASAALTTAVAETNSTDAENTTTAGSSTSTAASISTTAASVTPGEETLPEVEETQEVLTVSNHPLLAALPNVQQLIHLIRNFPMPGRELASSFSGIAFGDDELLRKKEAAREDELLKKKEVAHEDEPLNVDEKEKAQEDQQFVDKKEPVASNEEKHKDEDSGDDEDSLVVALEKVAIPRRPDVSSKNCHMMCKKDTGCAQVCEKKEDDEEDEE
jgi:hypothetical protein